MNAIVYSLYILIGWIHPLDANVANEGLGWDSYSKCKESIASWELGYIKDIYCSVRIFCFRWILFTLLYTVILVCFPTKTFIIFVELSTHQTNLIDLSAFNRAAENLVPIWTRSPIKLHSQVTRGQSSADSNLVEYIQPCCILLICIHYHWMFGISLDVFGCMLDFHFWCDDFHGDYCLDMKFLVLLTAWRDCLCPWHFFKFTPKKLT